MNRNNKIDYIELPVNNSNLLEKNKSFFSTVFGWSYKDWGNDYSDTNDSGIGSGINADPDHKPVYPLVVIYVEDLEFVRDAVVSSGGTITKEIFPFPGGRRFHFKDLAQNELAVWSDRE